MPEMQPHGQRGDWSLATTMLALQWLYTIILAHVHTDGFVQDCSNSSALAVELLQSCTKPSISYQPLNRQCPREARRSITPLVSLSLVVSSFQRDNALWKTCTYFMGWAINKPHGSSKWNNELTQLCSPPLHDGWTSIAVIPSFMTWNANKCRHSGYEPNANTDDGEMVFWLKSTRLSISGYVHNKYQFCQFHFSWVKKTHNCPL